MNVLTRLPGNVIIFKSRGNPYKFTRDDGLIKLSPARGQEPLFRPFESGGSHLFLVRFIPNPCLFDSVKG